MNVFTNENFWYCINSLIIRLSVNISILLILFSVYQMKLSKYITIKFNKQIIVIIVHFLLYRYDVELYQKIETLIGKKLPLYPTKTEEVMMLVDRVTEAQLLANKVIF